MTRGLTPRGYHAQALSNASVLRSFAVLAVQRGGLAYGYTRDKALAEARWYVQAARNCRAGASPFGNWLAADRLP